MTVIELKQKIYEAIEHVPEDGLSDVLNFVRAKQVDTSKKRLDEIFERILIEDRGLLQRLANS